MRRHVARDVSAQRCSAARARGVLPIAVPVWPDGRQSRAAQPAASIDVCEPTSRGYLEVTRSMSLEHATIATAPSPTPEPAAISARCKRGSRTARLRRNPSAHGATERGARRTLRDPRAHVLCMRVVRFLDWHMTVGYTSALFSAFSNTRGRLGRCRRCGGGGTWGISAS